MLISGSNCWYHQNRIKSKTACRLGFAISTPRTLAWFLLHVKRVLDFLGCDWSSACMTSDHFACHPFCISLYLFVYRICSCKDVTLNTLWEVTWPFTFKFMRLQVIPRMIGVVGIWKFQFAISVELRTFFNKTMIYFSSLSFQKFIFEC